MKKISIIIPVYNVEKYLEKCLKSLKNQTYRNIEVICVNDGSTDNSKKICEKFAQNDSRFIVINQENAGVSSSRNRGLELATGEYIGFVDGDDWIEPNMYTELVSLIEYSDDIDIVSCGYSMDYESRCIEMINRKKVPEKKALDMFSFLYYIYKRDVYKAVASYLMTKLFRTKLINGDYKVRFKENLVVGEDILFTAECYVRTKLFIYTKEPYYHYVQRMDSTMHNNSMRLIGGSCEAYQELIDLYKNFPIKNKVINYIKRFYVYHALELYRIALHENDVEKGHLYKECINKYRFAYILTNLNHPSRIVKMLKIIL